MRPVTFESQQIIDAGIELQAENKNITGFALRGRVGGGNPGRLKQVWDEYLSSQNEVVIEPVAELPVEVAEEVKIVSAALAERINQLATELNDKAVRAAERRVAEVTRAAGEQTSQAERELADAAQTVDDLEADIDALQEVYNDTLSQLNSTKDREQSQAIEIAKLKERLSAKETQIEDNVNKLNEIILAHDSEIKEMKDQHAEDLKDLRDQHAENLKDLREKHAEDLKDLREQHDKKEVEYNKRIVSAEKKNESLVKKQTDEIKEIKKSHSNEVFDLAKQIEGLRKEIAIISEAKGSMAGELSSLKSQNKQLMELIAVKENNSDPKNDA